MIHKALLFVFTACLPLACAAQPDDPAPRPGKLLIAGGGVRSAKAELWERMLAERLCDRPIGIISTASENPIEQSARTAASINSEFGEGSAVAIALKEGDNSAFDPETVDLITRCGGFYFTGGLQSRTSRALLTAGGQRTPALAAIWTVYQQGGIVGGSSAGAAIMSDPMIASGSSSDALLRGATPAETPRDQRGVSFMRGLGFDRDILYCQHHIERGRFGRLLAALASDHFPQTIGIGVAEDTFVLADPAQKRAQILGARGVFYLDASQLNREADGGYSGIRLHYLDRGDSIHFATGNVQPAPGKLETAPGTSADTVEVEDAWARDAIADLLEDLAQRGPNAITVAHDENFDLIFTQTDDTRIWRQSGDSDASSWTITNISVSVAPRTELAP